MVKFQEMAEMAWKDVNEGILKPAPVSTGILTRILNLARIIDVTYRHNQDGYTHSEKDRLVPVAAAKFPRTYQQKTKRQFRAQNIPITDHFIKKFRTQDPCENEFTDGLINDLVLHHRVSPFLYV
ncbi:hypothetical protein K7X08_023766 [Anisodus acutangulus]|uniref:Uncharacterized protein n=1 Tax=Anisodus acutangulus TaxID=402998 RepID=A0A9Q1L922_9SOLA|nr:hypothetical protein K7X08_023766 [Anisodus acutangulus]